MVLKVCIAALLMLVGFGSLHVDNAVDAWRAMYPDDSAHQTALQLCYDNDRQFNRMSTQARGDCYSKWLPIIEARRQAREQGVSVW